MGNAHLDDAHHRGKNPKLGLSYAQQTYILIAPSRNFYFVQTVTRNDTLLRLRRKPAERGQI